MYQKLSFRLLTEYYSFLCFDNKQIISGSDYIEFPSPYGVLFILI